MHLRRSIRHGIYKARSRNQGLFLGRFLGRYYPSLSSYYENPSARLLSDQWDTAIYNPDGKPILGVGPSVVMQLLHLSIR